MATFINFSLDIDAYMTYSFKFYSDIEETYTKSRYLTAYEIRSLIKQPIQFYKNLLFTIFGELANRFGDFDNLLVAFSCNAVDSNLHSALLSMSDEYRGFVHSHPLYKNKNIYFLNPGSRKEPYRA